MGMNKRTALLSAAIITFGLGTLYLGFNMKHERPPIDSNSWDLLIFTQSWPKTVCYTWKIHNASHECYYPPKKNMWTIHGIWPTKIGTLGPVFCNKSVVFNPDFIYSIKDKLNEYWTDIELLPSNTTETTLLNASNLTLSHKKESIWAHEWVKHGSCAMSLPALDSEFKYFYQGIEWSEKYNIENILEKAGLKINSTSNFVTDYWKAVKSVLKTNSYVHCVYKSDTKEQLLGEIRICFDKTLTLIDCDGIMKFRRGNSKAAHLLTDCDVKKPILYLDYVPEHNISINSNSTNSNSTDNDKEWDMLIFSQSWPYTFCHTWTVNSNTHTCNLPANRNQWTIHGIWPTKIGTDGPSFCNNHSSFRLDLLDKIIPELHNRWTEIKGSKTWTKKQEGGLWKHEWMKHGTCAQSLPALNSELKYFKQGLDWSKQYQLSELLSKGGIKPGGTYPVNQFWLTLKTGLGKNPRIDCYTDKDSKKVYIDEVRLCFHKTLALIDCDTFRRNNNKPYTNCPLNQEIHYIGAVV
ncbi:uncharacterized protein LOC112680138 isoform X2 [Sipha flava]|uniref:Uncharacterized protein LOC112680138 isoform X2 n=1 Tax=Sipha flava TaxID=143950 RepID=A0A8B8F6I1_9HEMI|nr:uncharacterized protein LOC112680138 isoform X2 [Sipha flava]